MNVCVYVITFCICFLFLRFIIILPTYSLQFFHNLSRTFPECRWCNVSLFLFFYSSLPRKHFPKTNQNNPNQRSKAKTKTSIRLSYFTDNFHSLSTRNVCKPVPPLAFLPSVIMKQGTLRSQTPQNPSLPVVVVDFVSFCLVRDAAQTIFLIKLTLCASGQGGEKASRLQKKKLTNNFINQVLISYFLRMPY